jgi:hypothetical protein
MRWNERSIDIIRQGRKVDKGKVKEVVKTVKVQPPVEADKDKK